MTLDEAKIKYLNHLTAIGQSPGTIKIRGKVLDRFIRFVQPADTVQKIKASHVEGFALSLLPKNFADSTLCYHIGSIKGFFEYLTANKVLLINPAIHIRAPKGRKTLPRAVLNETEIRHIFTLPDTTTKHGIRDRAILELLYSSGIRRRELTGLDLYDVNLETREIKVTGKGSKQRIVPFGEEAKKWLTKYLEEVRSKQTSQSPAFFLTQKKGTRRMHHVTLNGTLRKYRIQSGLSKKWNTHSLRHTCATHLLAHGANIRHIQTLLGHSQITTTQGYTRVEITTLEKVYRKTHPHAYA